MNNAFSQTDFEQLLFSNRGRLLAIARTYAPHDTEDLLQDILLQLWRSFPGFQVRSTFDTWCYRIALNTAISWRRKAARRNNVQPTEPAALQTVQAQEVDPTQQDVADLIHNFAQSLSDPDRALLLMTLDDLPGEVMAETLGISPGAVRVRIHRLKQKLADWTRNLE